MKNIMQQLQTFDGFVRLVNEHLHSTKSIDFQYFNDIHELIKTSSIIKSIANQQIALANGLEIPLQQIVSINQHYSPKYADYENVISCRC
jgi:phage-related protein